MPIAQCVGSSCSFLAWRLPRALVAPLAAALVALAPPSAIAAKLYCRNLSFSGTGGCGRQDIVTIRVLDVNGDLVHQSCPVQVQGLESAQTFAARLPRDLGSSAETCPPDASEVPPPKKKCINGPGGGANGSCKYKWKAKKQLLEVCCWDGPNCKGPKIGNYCDGGANVGKKCTSDSQCPGAACEMRIKIVATGDEGVSVQKKIQGSDPDFGPTPVPVVVVNPTFVNVDPISMTQLPPPTLGSCRTELGKEMRNLAAVIIATLVDCHRRRMGGEPIADCNSVNPGSDPLGRVDTAAAELAAVAAEECVAGSSPFRLGYSACAPPCDTIVVHTCGAGTIGAPCADDASCDSTPGAGDGRCGRAEDWNAATDCMACLAENAVTAAITDKYGSIGSGLEPFGQKCQHEIGEALLQLVRTHIKEITKCQKLLDGGKAALPFCVAGQCTAPPSRVGDTCNGDDDCNPPENRLCKNADPKRKRGLAELQAGDSIAKACSFTDISTLDSCGSDLSSEQACVISNGREVANALSDILYPEGIGHTPCDPCPTPTPVPTGPTPTPTPGGLCPTKLSFVGMAGNAGVLDLGWTGQGHDATIVSDGKLSFAVTGCANPSLPCGVCGFTGPVLNAAADAGDIHNRRCTGDTSVKCTSTAECVAVGAGTCEFYFGSYQPLAAGGASFCIGNQVSGPISGTVDLDSGAGGYDANFLWKVYLGATMANPCPRCLGDGAPNDGARGGACDAGGRSGQPCDVNGFSPNLYFGATSLDCPPGALIATLPVKYANTTGGASKTLTAASPNCSMPGFTGLKCFCDSCATAAAEPCASNADCPGGAVCGGKRCVGGANNGAPCAATSECPGAAVCGVPGTASKPNACDDFICSPNSADPDGPNEGVCAGGPLEMFCGPTATFRQCLTHADCAAFPGDTCSFSKFRECFTDNGLVGGTVNATGVANGLNPTVAALFCLGPTSSPSVNTVWGLPGLGRLELPGTIGTVP